MVCIFFTKPENKEQLAVYYAMTRPLGFWGSIKKEALAREFIKEEDVNTEGWGLDDVFGCFFAALSYVLWMITTVWMLLNDPRGYVTLIGAVVVTVAMYKILDPKFKRQSESFEDKQAYYKTLIEESQRWLVKRCE